MANPHRFYIDVWNKCDLNCRHCFSESGKSEGRLVSIAEVCRVIDDACLLQDIREIQITGGEPTQRPDICEIIGRLLEKGLTILLQTNGAFNESIRDDILRLPGEKVQLIVSLDGIEANSYLRGEDATRRTIENIGRLREKFAIRINTLLSSIITWSDIEQLASLASTYDLTLAFNPICPSGRADVSLLMDAKRYFDLMYRLEDLRDQNITVRKCFGVVNNQLIEQSRCPVRWGHAIHVAAGGSVAPCGFLANNPECQMGSIRGDSVNRLRSHYPSPCMQLASECQACEYYRDEYCHGGCPARIYGIHGRFDAVDCYCMARYYRGDAGD